MSTKHRVVTRVALSTLSVFAVMLRPVAANPHSPSSPEGAWYGTVTATNLPGATPFSGTDIYFPSTARPMREGTVLCTIGTGLFPIIVDGQFAFMVDQQPTASGSWVRIDKETIAVTLWRLAVDPETRQAVGSVKNWGTGTMPSRDQLRVEITSQFYDMSGVPVGMPVKAIVSSERVRVELEEAAAEAMGERQ